MKVQDALRAQYFLAKLERAQDALLDTFAECTICEGSFRDTVADFTSDLCLELDQLLLPTIVFEIEKAKAEGLLNGRDPAERYSSFFLNGAGYSQRAVSLIDDYPFLFSLVDRLIEQTFASLTICIAKFLQDKEDIAAWMSIPYPLKVMKLHPLARADRHRGQQAICITLTSGKTIIYKPVDLGPDVLFADFVDQLHLSRPYDLHSLVILQKDGYGWIQLVQVRQLETEVQISHYYKKVGVLLAIAEALNYSDGHSENLFASAEYPYLLDGESLFRNYVDLPLEEMNLMTTLLVQKVSSEDIIFLNTALQAPSHFRCDFLQTHAIDDRTDNIKIRYSGISDSVPHHCPKFAGRFIPAHSAIDALADGYCHGYQKITQLRDAILGLKAWWDQVASVQARIVFQSTASYLFAIRKVQQPESISHETKAENLLLNLIPQSRYSPYEIAELLSLNIPFFYHYPGARHVYDSHGTVHENVFLETGVERLRRQMRNRSEEKMRFNCELLRRHVVPLEAEALPTKRALEV